MGTEHPKVTAYIPQVILEALDDWKKEAGIESRSAAIVEILADYLKVRYQVQQEGNVPTIRVNDLLNRIAVELAKLALKVTALDETGTALEERVTALEQRVVPTSTVLNEVLSTAHCSEFDKILRTGYIPTGQLFRAPYYAECTLASNVPYEVRNTAPEEDITTLSEAQGKAPSPAPRTSTAPANKGRDKVPSTASTPTPPPTPLSQGSLAKRLGVSDNTVQKQRRKGKESFAYWSRKRDPDNVAWTWEGSGGRGQPLRFVPLC